MREYFTINTAWARKVLADANLEKQEGIQGRWQQQSPFKEVREQVKRNSDTDCNAQKMRRAYNAKKSGNWVSFKEERRKEGKLCKWTIEKLQDPEAHDKVALEDIGRLSNLLALHMVGIDGTRRRQQQKEEALQLVVCSMRRPIRMDSTIRILVVRIGANADRANVFKAHAAPLELV